MTPEWRWYCVEWAIDWTAPWVRERIGGWPRNWRQAAALYRREGVRSFAELASKLLEEIPPAEAKWGDVVMVDGAFGICRGRIAEFMDQAQPMERATRAWRASSVKP